jgi:hypothetical protein
MYFIEIQLRYSWSSELLARPKPTDRQQQIARIPDQTFEAAKHFQQDA